MKKLLLLPALLFASATMANEYKYEITPLIGYNIAEGNLALDNYAVFGAEIQYNDVDFVLKPELSIFYSNADYDNGSDNDTDIIRVALNGVYEFSKIGSVIPLAKVGLGYENMSDSYLSTTGNKANCAFIDAGVGAKIPFNDAIALKFEAIYMNKYNDARFDSNLMVTAGINIAFGGFGQKQTTFEKPVVEDTKIDEKKALEEEKARKQAEEKALREAEAEKKAAALLAIANGDDDKDGVRNADDKCKSTVSGDAVDENGCAREINLNINFENGSSSIDEASKVRIMKIVDFLKENVNYKMNIVGYTDNTGNTSLNKKLSQDRAESVKMLIIKHGIDASRLDAIGKGDKNPIADNSTQDGRAKNRRIEAELFH